MKKLISSTSIKIISLILCYISVYLVFCYMNRAFRYYTLTILGLHVPRSLSFLAFFVGIASLALFSLSVFRSNHTGKSGFIRLLLNMDYVMLSLLTAILLLFCAILLENSAHYFNLAHVNFDFVFILTPIFAYLIFMAFYVITLLHIRDKSFLKALYWMDFFKKYPLSSPMGLIMAILLLGSLSSPFLTQYLFFRIFFPALLLVGLTYFRHHIHSLSAEFEKAAADKIKSERLKSELIANVSHDLRTPLTSIINYIDLIKKLEVPNNELNEYTDILVKSSSRLKQLIEDLMEASKAGTGNLSIHLQNINFTELLGQIEGEYDGAFTEKQLTLILNLPDEAIHVLADANHLWRVMTNVFGNASKYAMPQTRIYADVKKEGELALFSLKNVSLEPLNISPDDLTEQFVRGDHSRHTEGSGLGLYIADNLMELMGGRFEIVINGDLFEVRLWLKLERRFADNSNEAVI